MTVPESARRTAVQSATRMHGLAADLAMRGMFAASEIVAGGAHCLVGLLALIDRDKPIEGKPGDVLPLRSVPGDAPEPEEGEPCPETQP